MSTIETFSNPNKNSSTEPLRLPKKTRPPLLDFALPAVAIGSGVMLGFAMTSIVDADSIIDYAKAAVLAFSATAVSYGVNKLAIERGAPQAATGYLEAGVVSVASILAVGCGLFAATYAGLTLKDTAELQLQEHGQALSVYVGNASGNAAGSARVDPVVGSIAGDLANKLACEIGTSCISGRGKGGHGPVARVVEEYAGRAASVAEQVAAGAAARGAIVSRMNGDLAAYQTALGDEDKDVWARRADLQGIAGRIGQSAGELTEVVPLALLTAYAGELQTGVSIPGRPEAEARLNGILSRHGQSLASVIATIAPDDIVPPAFPKRTGVSDTFAYIAHFLPIAAIAAVVELIFPLVLWAYTLWGIDWGKRKEEALRASQGAHITGTASVLPQGAVEMPPLAEASRRGRNGHVPRGRDQSRHF